MATRPETRPNRPIANLSYGWGSPPRFTLRANLGPFETGRMTIDPVIPSWGGHPRKANLKSADLRKLHKRLFENARPRIFCVCSGPRPHPATHESMLIWVAGWGRGPAPRVFEQTIKTSRDARVEHPSLTGGRKDHPTARSTGTSSRVSSALIPTAPNIDLCDPTL